MLGCSHIFSLTTSIEEWDFCHHAQEQEDDAMLLGAKFCSDTFANIQLDLAESNLEFCFYARLDRKGEVTVEGQHNHVKHQVITLCDDTGDSLPLVLWDDQISISSLLRYVHYA